MNRQPTHLMFKLMETSWSPNASCTKTVNSSVDSLRLSDLSTEPSMYTAMRTPPTISGQLSHDMIDAAVQLAKTTGRKLVHEAQTSSARQHVSSTRNVHVYQAIRQQTSPPPCEAQPKVSHSHSKKRALVSIPRSLWNRLTRRRGRSGSRARALSNARRTKKQPPKPSFRTIPRIVGVTRVHVSLDELLEIVGHGSAHATSLLHPSMQQRGQRHTLIDSVDEHVCIRSIILRTPRPTVTEPREFLVVEYQRSFEARTGRRGYVVACHSVQWDQCPSPAKGVVRASLYESGLVAFESEADPETVELFCVAEMKLKGRATEAENVDASRHRVIGTLARITQTIEERTKMLLSLDHTHVFHSARQATSHDDTCSGCHDRIGKRSLGVEPYACRKCYAKVCDDCSSIWQRGQKRMRLCMECWADAELNRT